MEQFMNSILYKSPIVEVIQPQTPEIAKNQEIIYKKDVAVQSEINNGWTDLNVIQMKRKMGELKIYIHLHKEVGNYYTTLHKRLFLPQTTIMTIASGTLFVSLTDKIGNNGRYWINMFVSFLTLIGSILSIWVKFFDAENKASSHLETSKNCTLILEDIEEQLGLDYDDKTNYKEYKDKIKKMIAEEKQKALDIEELFWNKYFDSIDKGEILRLSYNIIQNEIDKELNQQTPQNSENNKKSENKNKKDKDANKKDKEKYKEKDKEKNKKDKKQKDEGNDDAATTTAMTNDATTSIPNDATTPTATENDDNKNVNLQIVNASPISPTISFLQERTNFLEEPSTLMYPGISSFRKYDTNNNSSVVNLEQFSPKNLEILKKNIRYQLERNL
jgi:hypothetical protein